MRQVRVLHNYQGMPSQNQVIVAGDYAPDDERLFGLAAYLVENRHAEWVGDDESQPIPERSDEPAAPAAPQTSKRSKRA